MTPLWPRVKAAVRATAMVFGRYAQRRWSTWLGATRFNYERETNPSGNSIVQATVGWVCRTFPEAPIRVLVRRGQEYQPIPDHPMLQLIRRPNPFYSGILLWMATIASWMLTGNAYWLKIRSQNNRVVQLWWVPSQLMEPYVDQDSTAFIDGYNYNPDGRAIPIEYAVSDVVHFRYGLDPDNPRKGLSPLASLIREIFTDDVAANFAASILRNLGVPGVVIMPDDADGTTIDGQDADEIKDTFAQRFGGDNRGQPLVLHGKSKVQVLSFSPDQMNLRDLRRLPEERVTALLGIPAIVVGLGAGLERSTFSNMSEAREAAYESNVIPSQRLFAEELRLQLLPDFMDIERAEVDFDLSKVRVLQDDQNKLVERHTRSLTAGGMLLNTYLRLTNQDEIGPDGDVFLVPTNLSPTPPKELTAVPEMPPTPPMNGALNGAASQNGQNGKVLLGV